MLPSLNLPSFISRRVTKKRQLEPDKREDRIPPWLVTYLTRRLMASVIRECGDLDQDGPDGMYPDIHDEGVSAWSPWLKRFKTDELRFSTETPVYTPSNGKLISNLEDLAKQPELSSDPHFWALVRSVRSKLPSGGVDKALLINLLYNKGSLEDFDTTVAVQLCQQQILPQLELQSENDTDKLNTLWEEVISIYLEGVKSILSGNNAKAEEEQIDKITDQPL